MNKLSPEQDRANEALCRRIFAAASASEERMDAAAEAPFLYQRIRNEIAQNPKCTTATPARSFFADWFAWRWAGGALAALLLAIGLWQLLPQRAATPVARFESVPKPTLPTPEAEPSNDKSVATPTLHALQKTAPVRGRRPAQPRQRQVEVTSDFIPLIYVADSGSVGGHLIRIEVTPSTLASLGFPLPSASDKKWVKADVMLGDDGLARAIRFVE
ncbi:MAG: hypothetical protein JST84_00995 [Acidobacteria bacterium]|nr:hypothetical protein [Acidobacteriota bacterium]